MKKLLITTLALLTFSPSFAIAQTSGPNFSLSANTNLIKGCPSTINLILNTAGESILATDTTIFIDTNEVDVTQFSVGSILPMQTFNDISGSTLAVSAARFPSTGAYTGTGVLGTFSITPSLTADNISFNFSSNFTTDNLITNDAIQNVITSATDRTYLVRDRYNADLDGTGFCNPDTQGPVVQKIFPNNDADLDSNVRFSLTDNRTGVDINSLSFSINGVSYTNTSPQVTITESNGAFVVETNPDADFLESQTIRTTVDICDNNNDPSPNCTNRSFTFTTFTPPPPEPVCGDGIPTYSVGEQCDDGNTVDGDGCSALCIFEIPEPEVVFEPGPSAPVICPEPVIITEVLECPAELPVEEQPAEGDTQLELSVASESKVISTGQQLLAEGVIRRSNVEEPADLPLYYEIRDDQGNIVLAETEVVTIQETYNFSKVFNIEDSAVLGSYTVVLEVVEDDIVLSSSDIFQIVDKATSEQYLRELALVQSERETSDIASRERVRRDADGSIGAPLPEQDILPYSLFSPGGLPTLRTMADIAMVSTILTMSGLLIRQAKMLKIKKKKGSSTKTETKKE